MLGPITVAVYLLTVTCMIMSGVLLEAGRTGISSIFEIYSWQKCRKLMKIGWSLFALSFVFAITAWTLCEVFYSGKYWGWQFVMFGFMLGGLLIIAVVPSDINKNPFKPITQQPTPFR